MSFREFLEESVTLDTIIGVIFDVHIVYPKNTRDKYGDEVKNYVNVKSLEEQIRGSVIDSFNSLLKTKGSISDGGISISNDTKTKVISSSRYAFSIKNFTHSTFGKSQFMETGTNNYIDSNSKDIPAKLESTANKGLKQILTDFKYEKVKIKIEILELANG